MWDAILAGKGIRARRRVVRRFGFSCCTMREAARFLRLERKKLVGDHSRWWSARAVPGQDEADFHRVMEAVLRQYGPAFRALAERDGK